MGTPKYWVPGPHGTPCTRTHQDWETPNIGYRDPPALGTPKYWGTKTQRHRAPPPAPAPCRVGDTPGDPSALGARTRWRWAPWASGTGTSRDWVLGPTGTWQPLRWVRGLGGVGHPGELGTPCIGHWGLLVVDTPGTGTHQDWAPPALGPHWHWALGPTGGHPKPCAPGTHWCWTPHALVLSTHGCWAPWVRSTRTRGWVWHPQPSGTGAIETPAGGATSSGHHGPGRPRGPVPKAGGDPGTPRQGHPPADPQARVPQDVLDAAALAEEGVDDGGALGHQRGLAEEGDDGEDAVEALELGVALGAEGDALAQLRQDGQVQDDGAGQQRVLRAARGTG